ncbi:MAG TPA: YqjK family protein [Burkholderiales bacterium]|nr:YqjK family protein [Burkholderiales bacterium]
MSALQDILQRRARLVAEAQAQRDALAADLQACHSVVVVVDRGITLARWMRARPYLVVALVTAIAVLKPRFALAWSARVLTLWRAGRFLYEAVKPALGSRKSGTPLPRSAR